MKKIVIAGFGQPALNLVKSFKQRFTVLGIIHDYERKSKFPSYYESLANEGIPVITFEDANTMEVDGIIVINYNKIIDVSVCKVPFLLNVHMGLLPIYRGNNANAWSLLNGDRNVGYTLHEVSSELDGGDIYYKFGYEIKETETYFQAKEAINSDLDNSLPNIVEKVINGEIKPTSQENSTFVYASKLFPEDGILKDFNCTTDDIINRNMIFSRPLGTGLKMIYKNEIIEIGKITTIPNYMISKGFPGAVVLKNTDGSVWIKTSDTAISIGELIINETKVAPANVFSIGERL